MKHGISRLLKTVLDGTLRQFSINKTVAVVDKAFKDAKKGSN